MTSTYATPATVQSGYTGWRSALVLSAAEQHACLNLHRLHQLVLAGFRNPALSTAAPAERPPSVLYAADRGPARTDAEQRPLAGPPKAVLVQSPYQPNWQPLLDSGRLTRRTRSPPRTSTRPDSRWTSGSSPIPRTARPPHDAASPCPRSPSADHGYAVASPNTASTSPSTTSRSVSASG